MAEHTPTMDEVREAYIDWKDFEAQVHGSYREHDDVHGERFHRWLAVHDAEVAAKAWDEGRQWLAEQSGDVTTYEDPNPYRSEGRGMVERSRLIVGRDCRPAGWTNGRGER